MNEVTLLCHPLQMTHGISLELETEKQNISIYITPGHTENMTEKFSQSY